MARPLLIGAALSLAVHLAVALFLMSLPTPMERARTASIRRAYQVDLDTFGDPRGTFAATARGESRASADELRAGGARNRQNIDAARSGEGGDATGAAEAIRLLNRADGIVLFDSPLNNIAAAQSQRIRTARDRASLERRRATPNPADEVFLASGPGGHRERRPVSADDAAPGARTAPAATQLGGRPSIAERSVPSIAAAPSPSGERVPSANPAADSAPTAGATTASPGRGILAGEGRAEREAARVAHARPSIDPGPAATFAETEDARIRDRDDAELLATSMMQSWVESTARSGPRIGAGRGGVGAGGAPGSGGGRGEGGHASSYGPGDGRFAALDTSDGRYRRWFLTQRRRVTDALRFPRARALAMDQGISIYSIVVRRDGTLAAEPQLVRTSGFDDMDRAALAAIEAATPFAPLPDDLAPGLDRLHIRLPVEFSNPMVQ